MSWGVRRRGSGWRGSVPQGGKPGWRRWVHRGFLAWGIGSTLWLANTFRTRGVDAALLDSSDAVQVSLTRERLDLRPRSPHQAALLFFTGGGVHAEAYVPLLRPLADSGFRVAIVRLPWRLAPHESHKVAALDRAMQVIGEGLPGTRWVVAGHSLGGALAARLARDAPPSVAAIVLVGTSHPRDHDLSGVALPILKVTASGDGIASPARVEASRHLLPAATRWVVIEGGNHSQFGHYGSQLFDGRASISREQQQEQTRAVLASVLATVDTAHNDR